MSLRLQSSTHTQQPPRKTNKMLWNRAFFLSSLLLVSDASPLTHSNHVRSKEVTWAPCGLEDIPESVQCGNLIVPMGYTEPDPIETIDLQMLNVPALHEPSKGSILFSFAINSGSSLKDRFWFGYVFRGGPTTLEDYERDPEPHAKAQGSIAFSLKSLGEENYPVGLQTTLNVFNAEK
ncbi:hypothetical protein BDV29DRAFT_162350 [Aspergillus leporis]|uniref:Uncharacterized protein n=1 Tax=Aspergillus leporis TaxID=41062 RepID=A0A5N5WJ31_9EURO|nr:hypothetical protein BDV29DRAFT_162350 [Aspergillus leporis]